MIYINRFFFNISRQLKKIYLNSNIYDKKISKINTNKSINIIIKYIDCELKRYKYLRYIFDKINIDRKTTKWDPIWLINIMSKAKP